MYRRGIHAGSFDSWLLSFIVAAFCLRFSSGPVVSGFGSFSSILWTMPSSCSASFLFSFDLCYLAYYSLVVYFRKIMSISIWDDFFLHIRSHTDYSGSERALYHCLYVFIILNLVAYLSRFCENGRHIECEFGTCNCKCRRSTQQQSNYNT